MNESINSDNTSLSSYRSYENCYCTSRISPFQVVNLQQMKYFHLRRIVSILTACLFCYSKEIVVTAKYRTEEKHLKAELTMDICIDCGQEMLLPDNGIVAVSPPRLITEAALFGYQVLQACRSGCSFRLVSVVAAMAGTTYARIPGLLACCW